MGCSGGQIHIYLPPEHPIIDIETIEFKMAAETAKWAMLCACTNFGKLELLYMEVTSKEILKVL